LALVKNLKDDYLKQVWEKYPIIQLYFWMSFASGNVHDYTEIMNYKRLKQVISLIIFLFLGIAVVGGILNNLSLCFHCNLVGALIELCFLFFCF
jgi:hypothetical protein